MDNYKVEIISDDYTVHCVKLPGAVVGIIPDDITDHFEKSPVAVVGTYRRMAEYPSLWFKKNVGRKPPLKVPKRQTDNNIWSKMIGHAISSTVNHNVAVLFLTDYIVMNYGETLTSEWSSYGVKIGDQSRIITPLDLVAVTSSNIDWSAPEGIAPDEQEKRRFFFILLAGYRYGIASEIQQGDYKSVVLGKINQVLRNKPFNLDTDLTPTEMNKCRSWYNNSEFKVIIAALDMFWAKFPNSIDSKLRVCTLNSRYKDCSSISEIRHLSQISGMKIFDILKYVFSTHVRDEIQSIGQSGEEIDKEDSYFPYMMELRLSRQSPYSSTKNYHLFNWISIFCTLLGNERSFNARVVSKYGLLMAMNLALFTAYAFRKYSTPPSSLDVFKHMKECNNSVPPEIGKMFAQSINKMGTPRKQTIGMFLKNNILY